MQKLFGKIMREKVLMNIIIFTCKMMLCHCVIFPNVLNVFVWKFMILFFLLSFFFALGFTWTSALKKANTELKLLYKIDMLLMIEKEIRDGIFVTILKHGEVINKYMKFSN